VIVFAANFPTTASRGLFRVSAAGGVAAPMTVVDPSRRETAHRFPRFLPDGRHFLYLRISSEAERTGVYAGSIDSKPDGQSRTPVLLTDRQVMYTSSAGGGPGRLLFLRDTTLFAQPFDADRVELKGEPTPVADQVGSFAGANAGLYSLSETGVLAYRVGPGGDQRQLTWFDSQGKILGTVGEKGTYLNPAISPDGTRVAVTQLDREGGNSNIWVLDLQRGTSTKVTFSAGRNDFAIWSPDGKSVAFASNRTGHLDLYRKNADGSGEETVLLKSDADKTPTSWSRDGRLLLYTIGNPTTQADLWALPLQGDRKAFTVLATAFPEGQGSFSPDGRWIAYASTESGSPEVYVRPFSAEKTTEVSSGGKWLISKNGGLQPRWRADGRELFYYTTALQLMAVDISTEKGFQAGIPRQLFNIPLLSPGDVAPDGKRFLYPAPEGANACGYRKSRCFWDDESCPPPHNVIECD
jgi:hypothetical protein